MRELVLLSGGLDSTVIFEMARRTSQNLWSIFYDYGQESAQRERSAATRIGAPYSFFNCLKIDGIRLASDSILYFNRNASFLSIAASYAEAREVDRILFGANADDYRDFPDCRPEFLNAFNSVLAVQGMRVRIEAPLLFHTKEQIVAKAKMLGIDLASTWSCYSGRAVPCGECYSCTVLEAAKKKG